MRGRVRQHYGQDLRTFDYTSNPPSTLPQPSPRYRFFHKYPEKELRITGILFGTLIQHQLVSSITLGIALRYVLEALRKPPGGGANGKMFRFGMFALEQFKARLYEWPQYCSHIVQIDHLKELHADVRPPTPPTADRRPLTPQYYSAHPTEPSQLYQYSPIPNLRPPLPSSCTR